MNETVNLEDFLEDQSKWLSNSLKEDPKILSIREQMIDDIGGYSFANVVHCETTSDITLLNKHFILELIYQHLLAIGMDYTADVLVQETGHQFQKIDQPWEKTDLHLLTSVALSHREDPWNINLDSSNFFLPEIIEEDYFASPYREDPNTIWEEYNDKDLNATYKLDKPKSFSTLETASLKRIIIYLALARQENVKDEDQQLFFLSLHSITSADHFLRHLVKLYECESLQNSIEENKKVIKLGIVNLIRKWIDFHGLFIGISTIKSLILFLKRIENEAIQTPGYELISKVINSLILRIPDIKYGMNLGNPNEPPEPVISNPQIIFSPDLTLLMPDSIEVARQISYHEHKVFKAIHSLELIIAFSKQNLTIQTPTLKEFFTFGQNLQKNLLNSIIYSENYFESYKKLLDIAEQLEKLNNFNSLYNILLILKNEDIIQLCELKLINNNDLKKKIFNKIQELWENCGKNGEDINKNIYKKKMKNLFTSWSSAIPNMTAELKSISSNILSLNDFKDGLINWEKRKKIAKRTAFIYRFQNQGFIIQPISQIQKVVRAKSTNSIENLYSLIKKKYKDKIDEKIFEKIKLEEK